MQAINAWATNIKCKVNSEIQQANNLAYLNSTSSSNRREARGIPSLLDPYLDLYLLVAHPNLNLDIDLAQAGTALKYALVQ